MSKVGLVTTFRFAPSEEGDELSVERCWSVLSSFLLFHLAKGVDHIFLYADADDHSDNVYIERVAKEFLSSQISVDVRNEAQAERQRRTCRLWDELGSFSATEVPARQSLNAEDAVHKAADMGLHWLLHLDIDELFYTSEPSIKPHFDRLNKLGVEQMTYANHEAVPTSEAVNDYFAEVHLFRVNHLMLPLSHEVGECTRFWRRKRQHGQYMLAYDNGKSAVKVLPGRIVPQSVHRWRTLRPDERKLPCQNKLSTADTTAAATGVSLDARGVLAAGTGSEESSVTIDNVRKGAAVDVPNGLTGEHGATEGGAGDERERENEQEQSVAPLVHRSALVDPRELRFNDLLECSDPCVLHYPSCGLAWLRDKYRLLGNFPSSWFGGKLPIAPCFHLDARNALERQNLEGNEHENEKDQRASDRSGGSGAEADAGRELYRREVMLCPSEYAEQMQVQLARGVLRTIAEAARVIKQVRDARAELGRTELPAAVSVGEATQSDTTAAAGKRLEGGPSQFDVDPLANAEMKVDEGGAKPASAAHDGVVDRADLSIGFDNSWILSAVARKYL